MRRGPQLRPPALQDQPEEPAGERLPKQCRKGSVAPLVERLEATLPLYVHGPATDVLKRKWMGLWIVDWKDRNWPSYY